MVTNTDLEQISKLFVNHEHHWCIDSLAGQLQYNMKPVPFTVAYSYT